MMRLAVLIMAHKAPSQVARLCDRLRSESVDLYVHVDAKSDQSQFTKLIKDVHFVEDRVSVRWGQLSIVEAMLNLLKAVELSNYDYVALISGQDYPIMNIETILKQLSDAPKREYIEFRELDPSNHADATRMERVTFYHWCIKDTERTRKYWNASHKYSFLKRKYPFSEHLYYGSAWWVLTSECVADVLDYINRTRKYLRYYRYSFASDEFFIHNILGNSKFADRISPEKFYIDWSEQAANPKILTVDDYQAMKSSGLWFARKFDTEVDASILDMLDNDEMK